MIRPFGTKARKFTSSGSNYLFEPMTVSAVLNLHTSGVYICKSIVNDLRHGNYICKSEVNYLHNNFGAGVGEIPARDRVLKSSSLSQSLTFALAHP